jgi:dihydrofolate reductase
MQPQELTLIVAATRSMGIGFQGGMPWQGLRKEMQYFARVTTRVKPQVRHRPPQIAFESITTGFNALL